MRPPPNRANNGSGWYSQLKPAHEPICLARKPLDGTLAHNLLGHGTGALHIDACRVPFRNTADEKESKNKNRHADFDSGPRDNHIYGADKADRTDYTAEARFTPTNPRPRNSTDSPASPSVEKADHAQARNPVTAGA